MTGVQTCALPILTIVGAPVPGRPCELGQLQAYYAARGVTAEVQPLDKAADITDAILEASAGAGLLVAGAFGHSRLREFIFGGTTRALLQAERPSLFLAH